MNNQSWRLRIISNNDESSCSSSVDTYTSKKVKTDEPTTNNQLERHLNLSSCSCRGLK